MKCAAGVRRTLFWRYGLIIMTVVSLTILYLWEQTQVIRHDSRIRTLRAEIETLKDGNDRLAIRVISLSQGCEVVRRAEVELRMAYPTEDPIVILRRADRDGSGALRDQSMCRSLSYSGSYDGGKSVF